MGFRGRGGLNRRGLLERLEIQLADQGQKKKMEKGRSGNADVSGTGNTICSRQGGVRRAMLLGVDRQKKVV